MRKYIAALFVVGLVLTGCGARQEAAPPPPTPTPKVTKTAGQIATAMKTRLPQVSEVIIWTETNDPSRLLGRPGQYTSAATLIDDRTWPKPGDDFPVGQPCVHADPGVNCGASIEVFATAADALRRSTYIQDLTQNATWLGVEYHDVEGAALLRVIGVLPPSVNRLYVAEFRRALK